MSETPAIKAEYKMGRLSVWRARSPDTFSNNPTITLDRRRTQCSGGDPTWDKVTTWCVLEEGLKRLCVISEFETPIAGRESTLNPTSITRYGD